MTLITFSCNSSVSTKLVSLPHDFLPSLVLLLLYQSLACTSPRIQLRADFVQEDMLNYILPFSVLISTPWISVGFIWSEQIIVVIWFLLESCILFSVSFWNMVRCNGKTGVWIVTWKLSAVLLWVKWRYCNLFQLWRGIRSEMIIYEWHK